MKTVTKSVWLMAICSFLFFLSPAEGADIDLYYTHLGCRVDKMPLVIRDVPVHHSDSWAKSGQGPVEQLGYDCNPSVTLSSMYTGVSRYDREKSCVNFGIGLDWLLAPQVGIGGDEAERNYMNAPGTDERGAGAALTYVGVRQAGVIPPLGNIYTDILLNWTPRVKLEVAPLGESLNRFWLGASVSYYTIDAQNGWDRNDSLEAHKEYVLLREFPVRVYATLFFSDELKSGVTAGVQLQQGSVTGIGKQADTTIDGSAFFLGLSFRL